MKAANLDPNDPQVRTAVFGQEVQDFLRGPIGDYLIKRAEKELQVQYQQLKTIASDRAADIASLQNRIMLLEAFESWLGNAVQDGLTAIANIDGEQDSGEIS